MKFFKKKLFFCIQTEKKNIKRWPLKMTKKRYNINLFGSIPNGSLVRGVTLYQRSRYV